LVIKSVTLEIEKKKTKRVECFNLMPFKVDDLCGIKFRISVH
jgi:hypothetical protein